MYQNDRAIIIVIYVVLTQCNACLSSAGLILVFQRVLKNKLKKKIIVKGKKA